MIQSAGSRRLSALILATAVAIPGIPVSAFAQQTGQVPDLHTAGALSVQTTKSKGLGTPRDPNCSIRGTAGDDKIIGTSGRDVICAGLGDDLVLGKGGDDVILGQGGDDRVRSGPGADKVDGARGDDTISGGKGPDGLYGSWGRDSIKGGPGRDLIESKPMPNFTSWTATMSASFDFPSGSRLDITYVPQSGKCLGRVPSNYSIASNDRQTLLMFVTSVPWPWDKCAEDPSSAEWDLTLTTPVSDTQPRETRKGKLLLTSGPPLPTAHTVVGRCAFEGVQCSITGASSGGLNVTVPAAFGPMSGPSPKPPSLNCQPNFFIPAYTTLNERNGHVCTIEGYPRPQVTVTGLPQGVKLQRWPSSADTWLVLQGVAREQTSYTVSVSADLPSAGWADHKTFRLVVQ